MKHLARPRRITASLALACALAFALVGLAARAAPAPARARGTHDARAGDAQPPLPACIRFWAEARMRAFGYDHVVHIANACAADARCVVTTDVNPQPTSATVRAKTETEVVTWMGSPARVFTPAVACQLTK